MQGKKESIKINRKEREEMREMKKKKSENFAFHWKGCKNTCTDWENEGEKEKQIIWDKNKST